MTRSLRRANISAVKPFIVAFVAALFLGTLLMGVVAGSSPGVLRVTGLLCDSGTRFEVTEGQAYDLPDQRRVAPTHFACVGPQGEHAPHFVTAGLVAWLVTCAAWFALARYVIWRSLQPSKKA